MSSSGSKNRFFYILFHIIPDILRSLCHKWSYLTQNIAAKLTSSCTLKVLHFEGGGN